MNSTMSHVRKTVLKVYTLWHMIHVTCILTFAPFIYRTRQLYHVHSVSSESSQNHELCNTVLLKECGVWKASITTNLELCTKALWKMRVKPQPLLHKIKHQQNTASGTFLLNRFTLSNQYFLIILSHHQEESVSRRIHTLAKSTY